MTCYHFALTALDTGQLKAHALICVEARYAALRWRTGQTIQRRDVPLRIWPSVAEDFRIGWEKGLVAPASATMNALVDKGRRGNLQVQLIAQPPIKATPAATVAQQLDDYLLAMEFV